MSGLSWSAILKVCTLNVLGEVEMESLVVIDFSKGIQGRRTLATLRSILLNY